MDYGAVKGRYDARAATPRFRQRVDVGYSARAELVTVPDR